MLAEHVVECVDDLGDAQFADALDVAGELLPELAQDFLPVDLAGGNPVEALFQRGSEIILHVAVEEAFEKRDDEAALVLRHQPLLLQRHVVTVLQHLQGGGVGGRAADAELLHALDQRCLGVARRRLGEVLGRLDRVLARRVAGGQRRQAAGFLVALGVVAAFLVEHQEAVEALHAAGGAQAVRLLAVRGDLGGGALQFRRLHLACDRAHPDQLVEPCHVGIEGAANAVWMARHVGRADGLVRFLCVLGLGLVHARRGRQVIVAVALGDHPADRGNRFRRHLDAVGSHVGDEALRLAVDGDALVELLRGLHGARGGKSELSGGLLLQRRSGEGRVGIALDRLALDAVDDEGGAIEVVADGMRIFGVGDRKLVELLAAARHEAGVEGVAGTGFQFRDDVPVFLRPERLDLGFAVAHQPQRHRLHTARRTCARQLAPQHGRQREADEVVERAPRQIGVDEGDVDLARVRHGVQNGRLGDGVEDDAFDLGGLERPLLLQHFQHVPGDCFTLAIGVGCQDQLVGALDG